MKIYDKEFIIFDPRTFEPQTVVIKNYNELEVGDLIDIVVKQKEDEQGELNAVHEQFKATITKIPKAEFGSQESFIPEDFHYYCVDNQNQEYFSTPTVFSPKDFTPYIGWMYKNKNGVTVKIGTTTVKQNG